MVFPWQELWDITCRMGSQCYLLPYTSETQITPCPNPNPQAGTRLLYPRRMEGWVDLGYQVMDWPGAELVTSWSEVWWPNHYTAEPNHHLLTCSNSRYEAKLNRKKCASSQITVQTVCLTLTAITTSQSYDIKDSLQDCVDYKQHPRFLSPITDPVSYCEMNIHVRLPINQSISKSRLPVRHMSIQLATHYHIHIIKPQL